MLATSEQLKAVRLSHLRYAARWSRGAVLFRKLFLLSSYVAATAIDHVLPEAQHNPLMRQSGIAIKNAQTTTKTTIFMQHRVKALGLTSRD